MRSFIASAFGITLLALGGCATLTHGTAPPPPYIEEGVHRVVLVEAFEVPKVIRVVDGQQQEVFWESLTEPERRARLPLTDTVVMIERQNTDGSFSFAPVSASAGKGVYRVSFAYMKYRNEACQPDRPEAGTVRIGVGLRVSATITTRTAGLNLGGLLPFAFSFQNKRMSGELTIKTIGIVSPSSVLSGYLRQGVGLTEESIVQAMESMAVAKAILEDNDTRSVPHAMAIVETTPGACQAVIARPPA